MIRERGAALRINAITNEVTEGDTGALAVPVRIGSGGGGTHRSCGASAVFGALAGGRAGGGGGASRRGERRPGLERSADGVGSSRPSHSNWGYSLFSLTRAFSVVNCQ